MDNHIESLNQEVIEAQKRLMSEYAAMVENQKRKYDEDMERTKDLEHALITAWQAMYDNQGEYAYISANGIHALDEMAEKMGLKQPDGN
jgi:hypothetical protein